MSVNSFKELREHIGHNIVCVGYGYGNKKTGIAVVNTTIECEECNQVLIDYDNPNP